VPLNESNTDVRVTFLRYIEHNNVDDTLRIFGSSEPSAL